MGTRGAHLLNWKKFCTERNMESKTGPGGEVNFERGKVKFLGGHSKNFYFAQLSHEALVDLKCYFVLSTLSLRILSAEDDKRGRCSHDF